MCVGSDRDELAFQLATLTKESRLESGNSADIPVAWPYGIEEITLISFPQFLHQYNEISCEDYRCKLKYTNSEHS